MVAGLSLSCLAVFGPPASRLGWAFLVILAILLAFIALITGWLLVRSFARSRERLNRRRAQPTEHTDVWSMHRLPQDTARGPDGQGDRDADEGESGYDDDDRPEPAS
jgi:hypothetical protein